MRSQLMSTSKCLLHSRRLVVDASVQGTSPEEGGLGTGLVQDVDQLGGVLVRAIVVGQSEHAGLGALGNDDAGAGSAGDELDGVGSRGGECRGGEEGRGEEGFGEHGGGGGLVRAG